MARREAQRQPRIDMRGYSPPTVDDVLEYFKHLRHSAPGPDGLPYAAWIAGGEEAAKTIIEVIDLLRNGVARPRIFVTPSKSSPPKGVRLKTHSK